MGKPFLPIALALATLVACAVASSENTAPSQFGVETFQLRQLLQQRNGDDSSNSQAGKVTGALALYSLFGIFVFSSVSTCVIGIIVILQWPNPRTCCYRTPHSDIPSSESCGCCALHRLNIGFAVTWLALLVLLVLAFIIYLMAAAAVLAIAHAAIAYRLIRQLKASYAASAQLQLATALEARTPPGLVTGIVVERPPVGVAIPGIPVINIPMTVAIVDAPLQTQVYFDEHAAAQRANAAAAAAASGLASGEGGGLGRNSLRRGGGAASPSGASGVGSPTGSTGGVAGAAGDKFSPRGLPVAPVVDGRVLQSPRGQQPDQQYYQQPQQQQRGAAAWVSPGSSVSGERPASGRWASAGDASAPGPSYSRPAGGAVAESLSPPQQSPGRARYQPALEPAAGVPVAPLGDIVVSGGRAEASDGGGSGPRTLRVDSPPLPGSPGSS